MYEAARSWAWTLTFRRHTKVAATTHQSCDSKRQCVKAGWYVHEGGMPNISMALKFLEGSKSYQNEPSSSVLSSLFGEKDESKNCLQFLHFTIIMLIIRTLSLVYMRQYKYCLKCYGINCQVGSGRQDTVATVPRVVEAWDRLTSDMTCQRKNYQNNSIAKGTGCRERTQWNIYKNEAI